MTKFIAYYRVSTQRQGQSGLGLDSQREMVRSYIRQDDTLVAEYTEVESGRKTDRKQLEAALKQCKKTSCKLIIAKLDRLARNVAFIANLLDSGIEFIAADLPHANRMMLQMTSVFAEYEAKMISERTKSALHQAKLRGVKLGSPKAKDFGKMVSERSDAFAETLKERLEQHLAEGLSANRIAARFNEEGISTARNGKWQATQVLSICRRLELVA